MVAITTLAPMEPLARMVLTNIHAYVCLEFGEQIVK